MATRAPYGYKKEKNNPRDITYIRVGSDAYYLCVIVGTLQNIQPSLDKSGEIPLDKAVLKHFVRPVYPHTFDHKSRDGS